MQLPEIEAAIALERNESAKGIELLESALPYERAYPDAIYVRGLLYLKMNRGLGAAAEFRKIADHEGTSWAATWAQPNWGQYYALSWLGTVSYTHLDVYKRQRKGSCCSVKANRSRSRPRRYRFC